MRVFILDRDKITKFNLPVKISGAFVFSYVPVESKVRRTVNIEAQNNKWIIKSNGSVDVVTSNLDGIVELEEYNFYQLKIKDRNDIIILYCVPSIENDSKRYRINRTQFTIGSSANNAIQYNNKLVMQTQIQISKQQEDWYIQAAESDSLFAYLNNERIRAKKLKVGDVIFLYGLKIIWMGDFIQVNNPLNKTLINKAFLLDYADENVYNQEILPVSEEDMAKELYEDKDYFFHTPRLKQSLVNEEVTIDPPPPADDSEDLPLLLQIGTSLTMVTSMLFSGYYAISGLISGQKTLAQSLPSIVLCLASLVGSLIMPRLINNYQKKRRIQKEKLRQEKYSQYIEEKEKEIKAIMDNQKFILNSNYPNLTECYTRTVAGNRSQIWLREIKDDDFLRIRLGTGTQAAKVRINGIEKHFRLKEDNLENKVIDITQNANILTDIPITFSFVEKYISSIICNIDHKEDYINGLILQLLAYHSPKDLKIVLLMDTESYKYEYIKYAPHCLSETKERRYFGDNIEDIKKIASELDNIFVQRKEQMGKTGDDQKTISSFEPHYLIITNNYSNIKNIKLIDDILKEGRNLGFSITFLEDSIQSLPNECTSFIEVFNNESCIIENDLNNQTIFKPELIQNIDMRKAVNVLANIPIEATDVSRSLPTSLTFLEMFNVGKIEQLNILNKWKTNDPTISIKAPIGVHTNGDLFTLDLHEKAHGPHGLIAGSTGSGKSEFIITYLLSMAINYHPDEVQFVLIDYKGGGLAGAFENRETGIRIPHVVGTITNLDVSDMNRSLVSINSELKRRQMMFNEAKTLTGENTIDIYKYQHYYREGVIKKPIAHLLIVCDEFAELKSQQPEFMSELISAARIGRALGVHLILATQKPSGVVNDQIWSNTKFRVCLKVQDRSDSMEVLKRADAASLKEAGRFYLQVGYDEYFDIGQSGWAGAKYIPTDAIKKKVDDSMQMIDNTGNIIKDIQEIAKVEETTEVKGDQLTNIVKYLANISTEENYVPNKLWLDKIPEFISLKETKDKYSYKEEENMVKPLIGEYDNPAEQEQGPLALNITDKNTLIYGMADSGKETLLSTLIYSTIITHSTDEINFYLMDFGAETLKQFQNTPQVGEVCTISDETKIFNTFLMIEKEMDRRKDLFIEYGGNYKDYRRISKEKLPVIHIIINNYEIFQEQQSKIAELLVPMFRDSSKYGITFTITTGAANSIRSRVTEYFQNKICMQMPNDTDYRSLLNSPRGLQPAKTHGRGICAVDDLLYEFQTAYIAKKEDIADTIRNTNIKLKEVIKTTAPKTPMVPAIVKTDDIIYMLNGLANVPIGFDVQSKQPITYNFQKNKFNVIIDNDKDDDKGFIYSLISIIKSIQNTKLVTLDINNDLNPNNVVSEYISSNYEEKIPKIIEEMRADTPNQKIYIVNGIGNLRNILSKTPSLYKEIIQAMAASKKTTILLIDSYDNYKKFKMETFFNQIINGKEGIWIGPEINTQIILDTQNMGSDFRDLEYEDMAYIVNEKEVVPIKIVTNKEEGDDNE